MMDLPIALYVMVRVSLSHPHSVPASAFRMLLRCCTRAAVCRVWRPKQNMVSNVTPRSFGVLLSGSVVFDLGMDVGLCCVWCEESDSGFACGNCEVE